jgi:HD-like signal output (HDOD) protein
MVTVSIDPSMSVKNRAQALARLSSLPPFSPVLNRLMATLADEDVSFLELGDLIEKDPVLAGNVLRLVNSALYARRGTVNSVRHAVSILGLAKLRNAVLSLSLGRLWSGQKWPPGWIQSQFNLHGVASGIMADLMAGETTMEYPEGAFAAGLLQNVGMLLEVVALGDDFKVVLGLYAATPGASLVQCEREVMGLDHAELSAEILKQWNLPQPIQVAVGEHHRPSPGRLGSVVAGADEVVQMMGVPLQPWHRAPDGKAHQKLESLGFGCQTPKILESFQVEYDVLKGFFSS